jgi:membrane fusion protein (multidrug efflux system)
MSSRAANLMLLIPIIASGCTRSEASPMSTRPPAGEPTEVARQVNVKVEPVDPVEVADRIRLVGEVLADAEVTYAAEVPGQVQHLGAQLGQRVRRGQILARIDYTALKAQRDEAEAALELARKTHARLASLAEVHAVAAAELDRARSGLVAAKARQQIAAANLEKSIVTAKRGGVVTRKLVEPGEYVAPGMPLFEVVDHRKVVVRAHLAESQVADVPAGTPARVSIDSLGRSFDTAVEVVLPVADPASKTYEIRLRLRNPRLAIHVGMSAHVELATRSRREVVLVSQDVVIEDGDNLRSVFVAADGIARRRPVKLGPTHGDRVVVLEGVTPGERVVVLGQRELQDGQAVRVVQ